MKSDQDAQQREKTMSERHFLGQFLALMFWVLAVVAGLGGVSARASDYPTRPIRILVPYAPGGVADIAARIVGAKLTDAWGQPVFVENRPGGSGSIGMVAAARSTPDGYTLVMATAGDVSIYPALFKSAPYDVNRDLAPIATVSDIPMVLATNGVSPYKTVAEVIAAARSQPGVLAVAIPGYGSINQLVLASLALNTGTEFVEVPYRGSAEVAQALVAGDVPLGMLASSSAAPHLPSGNIRVLGVTTAERVPFNPEWPTLREEGAGDINVSNWTALLAPKGTPQPIVDKLNAELVKILALPDVKERFAAGGVLTMPSSAAELDARIQRELAANRMIIEKANIHVD
jgi:tripartite-type tricarboxylate transporter receptor subunit TctC